MVDEDGAMRGMLFVIEGKLGINEVTVDAGQTMILGDEYAALATNNLDADHVTRFIIATGEPICQVAPVLVRPNPSPGL